MEKLECRLGVHNLSVYYDDFKALENINLLIPCKRITAFIGPSGCGKSTLLRCFNRMNDLVPGSYVEGSIFFDGTDIFSDNYDVTELRRKVGMVFQKPNPFPKTVYENVAYGPKIAGIKKKAVLDEIVERSLKRAALWDEVKDKLHSSALRLSGGQQQRLCIARALAVEPEIILLDEPCSALDPIATQRIEDLLVELAEKYTIIIVTHNMQQAARISHFTAFMMIEEHGDPGRIIEFGETSYIFTNPDNEKTERYITGRFG